MLLLVAVLMPRPGAAAGVTHPLDPSAKPAGVPTANVFDAYVPLLDRDEPVPSFAEGGADASPPAPVEAEPDAVPTPRGDVGPTTAE